MALHQSANSEIYDFGAFPLKDGSRFVTWVKVYNRGKKPTKVLKRPTIRGVLSASHSDPETWGTFDEAIAAYKTGRFTGIGYVFSAEDDVIGLDFDGVRDPETGEIEQDTLDWLNIFNSYTEISPSETGVKVWVRGELPRSYKKAGLEVYRSHRFFTITGWRLPQFSAEVETRREELDTFVGVHFPQQRRETKPREYTGDGEKLDLDAFLEQNNVEILKDLHDGTAALKYGIVCPWKDEHTTDSNPSATRVGQYEDGALFFHCEHSHCADRKWTEFRARFTPKIRGNKRNPKVYVSGKAVTINV